MYYLRARYYNPAIGTFVSRDPFEGTASRPMSLNGYSWVEGRVADGRDPSGMLALYQINPLVFVNSLCNMMSSQTGSSCSPSGATRCGYLASELACLAERYQQNLADNSLLYLFDENGIFVNLLADYYAAIPFTAGPLWVGELRPFPRGERELYPIPGEPTGNDIWRNPINYPGSTDEATTALLQSYGFRRPYFGNTHHFFAYLKLAYLVGIPAAGTINYQREMNDLEGYFSAWQGSIGTPLELDYARQYAWIYQEAVNDLYLTDRVFELRRLLSNYDVGIIADFVSQEMCATSLSDVWSLQSAVDDYYFDFPERYWPDESFRPR
jgi:hypothetical protein